MEIDMNDLKKCQDHWFLGDEKCGFEIIFKGDEFPDKERVMVGEFVAENIENLKAKAINELRSRCIVDLSVDLFLDRVEIENTSNEFSPLFELWIYSDNPIFHDFIWLVKFQGWRCIDAVQGVE